MRLLDLLDTSFKYNKTALLDFIDSVDHLYYHVRGNLQLMTGLVVLLPIIVAWVLKLMFIVLYNCTVGVDILTTTGALIWITVLGITIILVRKLYTSYILALFRHDAVLKIMHLNAIGIHDIDEVMLALEKHFKNIWEHQ